MTISRIDNIDRLRRINAALINRVERAMDQSQNAFSLFQTAIHLEGQVRRRTDELSATLRVLESSNADLAVQKEISEKANSLKTRFLAAASHDLLQPLHAAQLTISALADLQTNERCRAMAAQVERSLDTMNELLRTLLDISRLDAGVMVPSFGDFPLEPVVDSLLSDFRPVAEAKGLRLHARVAPLMVRTDRTMFRRILQNLLANAVRYTASGGVLIVARPRGGVMAVDIVDTGPGIPAEDQERVFDEFHRGAGAQAMDGQAAGLGLGLSIVRRLVDSLGHHLELHSRVGSGTRFRLWLVKGAPQANPDNSPPSRETVAACALSNARIMLVENDPAVVSAMSELLNSWGCPWRCASDPAEAIRAIDGTGWIPDLIIADQHLDHGALGTDVVARIRLILGEQTAAIIATADSGTQTSDSAKAIDAQVLNKPVKPAQLRALATYLLTRNVKTAPSQPCGS